MAQGLRGQGVAERTRHHTAALRGVELHEILPPGTASQTPGHHLEQAMLPAELVGARGSSYRVVFGRPVSAAMLRESHMPPQVIADRIKEWVYTPDLLTGTFKL